MNDENFKSNLTSIEKVSIYDATYEQLHSFRFLTSLGNNQHHQIMKTQKKINDLNLKAFEKSFEILIRRHESLRSFFQINNEEIKLCIIPYDKDIFNVHYYEVNEVNFISFISNRLEECEHSLLKIDSPPLLKCLIFNVYHRESFIWILMHHIISDEWSLRLILHEIEKYYDSFKNDRSIEIVPLKMQISEYSLHQKNWMAKNKDKIHDYWFSKLEPILNQNKSFYQTQSITYKSQEDLLNVLDNTKAFLCNSYIESNLYDSLVAVTSEYKISMCTLIITSLQMLFFILFEKDKILMPMPIINRQFPGTKELIGCFMGGIYMFHPLKQELSYKNFTKEVFNDFLNSCRYPILDHKEMSLDEVILRLQSDVYLNFIKKTEEKLNISKSYIANEHTDGHDPIFYALACITIEYENGILLNWKYNPDIFSPNLINSIIAIHGEILYNISRNYETDIRTIIDNVRKYSQIKH